MLVYIMDLMNNSDNSGIEEDEGKFELIMV